MPERKSALDGHLQPGQYGRVGNPGIKIREVPGLLVYQVSAWADSYQATRAQVCKAVGAESALKTGGSIVGEQGSVLHVEPLKWWLLGVTPVDFDAGQVLDISHSRTCLHVSGEQATALLNRHLPLDLRTQYCLPGSVQSCSFDHVGVTLWRKRQGFDLFIPRSFALSLFTMLCESAEQFGFELLAAGNTADSVQPDNNR